MAISRHIKTAYAELIGWLERARLQAAQAADSLVPIDAEFCFAADRFIAAIAMETGVDEVRRRMTYTQDASGPGSKYYCAALAACEAGVYRATYAVRQGPRKNGKKQWIVEPLRDHEDARLQWECIQKAIGKGKDWPPERVKAAEAWAKECDEIATTAERISVEGCWLLVEASELVPDLRAGDTTVSEYDFETPPGMCCSGFARSRNSIRAALVDIRQWLVSRSKSRRLKPKQAAALTYIKERGPVKGVLIANHIGVSDSTFRTHYLPVLRKLHVRNDGAGYYCAGD